MKIFGLTIVKTTEYEKMKLSWHLLAKKNTELQKQLIYQQTYNDTFKRKLDEIIFPNTDERGLGDQEVPVNFPDLW